MSAQDFSSNASYPIGMRQNNPGNLRSSIVPWMGQTGSGSDFCIFKDTSYGLRAMAVDLSNKILSDGLDTITDIITKYAPPSENDTASYIVKVSGYTGWGPDDPIDYTSTNLATLMRAQINVEQGESYSNLLSDSDIAQGITMIPQSITSKVESFFVDNPTLAVAWSLGVVAILTSIFFIVTGKINLKKLKSKL